MKTFKAVVGLGNKDARYDNTYHNIGFEALDKLAALLPLGQVKRECKGETIHTYLDKVNVILLKPHTYMNLSGESLSELTNKYKLRLEDVLVLVDDVDLPIGGLRYREKGSAGTHNGLRSIVSCLGSEFARLKIGIGRPPEHMDLAAFVLSRIGEEQRKELDATLNSCSIRALEWLRQGVE